MDSLEFLILIAAGYYTLMALYRWYHRIACACHLEKSHAIKLTLGLLPVISFTVILCTLIMLASFDVVDSSLYILFYIVLGFAWILIGIYLVFYFFDLSWIDDVLHNRNIAALFAVAGAFLGLTVIYSGANVGDGPGWWCVLFAGGLGVVAWFLISLLMNKLTRVFERITVERDMYCGIRFGSYLLASGLILGRASAGDWTSFSMTIVEFLVGWPVLPLTLLAVLIERFYINNAKMRERNDQNHLISSVYWGIVYILIAVFCIVMFPLVENPAYGGIPAGISGVNI